MKRFLIAKVPLVILLISTFLHFWKFGSPTAIVFDEVHIGKFVTGYLQGSYFFDVHPPFARLVVTFFGYLVDVGNMHITWAFIGDILPDPVILMRLGPVLAGIFLPLVIYYICRNLQFSKTASFLAGLLVCFENSLLIESRFMLHSSILILFGFLGILLYLIYIKDRKRYGAGLVFSALAISCAIATKWIGLSFMAVIGVFEIIRLLQSEGFKNYLRILKKLCIFSGIYTATIVILYIFFFVIHFTLLPKTGIGDAYMSRAFQKTLINNKYVPSSGIENMSMLDKIIEVNVRMFSSQKNLSAKHSYGSPWYTWPIMKRPIFYWQNKDPQTPKAYLYFIGNPFIYWAGSLSMVILLGYGLYLIVRKKVFYRNTHFSPYVFILFGYFINLLPFMLVTRIMFIYHYQISLIFSIVAIAYIVDRIETAKKQAALLVILCIAGSLFVYFSPLTYGTPLTDSERSARIWISSWR